MYEGGDGKNRETFPRIPDEPSKPRNFCHLQYAQKFAQNASRNFPKISPIMLLSVPIMLELCC